RGRPPREAWRQEDCLRQALVGDGSADRATLLRGEDQIPGTRRGLEPARVGARRFHVGAASAATCDPVNAIAAEATPTNTEPYGDRRSILRRMKNATVSTARNTP